MDRRRTASRAAGSGWPGRCRRARRGRGSARRPPRTRPDRARNGRPGGSPPRSGDPADSACRGSAARRQRQPGMDVVEPSRQPSPVAIERPPAEPGVPGSTIPGDHPVVQREAERRQVLVRGRDRRQPLEDRAEVVPEEPDEAAEERRRVGRHDRACDRGAPPAGGRRRTGPGRPPATRGRRPGRRSGRSTARSGRAGRFRGAPDPAGHGTPRRRRWRASPRSGRAAAGDEAERRSASGDHRR